MKKHWMLLAALFMLSCSDDNDPIKEEPERTNRMNRE